MRPSSLLGISPTDPTALLIDLTVSHMAQAHEIEQGEGDYWWLSILRALTGAGKADGKVSAEAPIDWSKVQWLG